MVLWDRTRSKAEALNLGRIADSPADASRDAEVVVSMVTGPEAVRAVYFGQAGVLEAAAGKTIVEMSTAGPNVTAELASAAKQVGARLIEAPVLGSIPAVLSGQLVILAGADDLDDVEAARPVLQALGEVHYVGGLGNAASLKLVANSMLAIVTTSAAELLAAGTSIGLDPEMVFWILSHFAPTLTMRESGLLCGVHEPAMFAMRDIVKDLDLALELYRRAAGSRFHQPLTSLTRELLQGVAARTPDLDLSAIVEGYKALPVRT